MKKVLFFSILTAFLCLGCNKNGASGGSVPDPEGTIEVNIPIGKAILIELGDIEIALQFQEGKNLVPFHPVRATDWYPDFKIASAGKVSGLGAISRIPASGWAEGMAATPGNGYVLKTGGTEWIYDENNRYVQVPIIEKYARVYVKEWLTSGSSIIGCTVAYQAPFVVE